MFGYHKCAGCWQRKRCDTPVGTSQWYCDDCAVFAGHFGTNNRLKNVAAQQSKAWNDSPCPHQTTKNVPFKDPASGRRGQACICQKCGLQIYSAWF